MHACTVFLLIEIGQRREREERATMAKQKEKGKGVKCRTGTKEEYGIVRVMQRERQNERKRDREEVKWSRAIREIEGMKVRDGEHKIMEGGREIEKGTLGSRSKSV